jgi:hypothetical protein
VAIPLNLTPDATGLKGWTYDDFKRTLTTGVRKNGTMLDPMMPVASFKQLNDTELKALWLYLSALPPLPLGAR